MDAPRGRDLHGCRIAPDPKPKGIRRRYREAAIFLPGAGIVRGAAMYEPVTWVTDLTGSYTIAPLTRSPVPSFQRNTDLEVNGIDHRAAC